MRWWRVDDLEIIRGGGEVGKRRAVLFVTPRLPRCLGHIFKGVVDVVL